MTRLDVVLPVYHEAPGLAAFVARLRAELESQGLDYRVHLCVDRSTDGTEEVAEELCRGDGRVRALLLSARFGHQESLLAGVAAARPDAAVLMMDADGQHPPELIPKLLEALAAGADVVLTRRLETRGQPLVTRLLSDNFYRVLSKLSSLPLEPGMADFRVVSPAVAAILRDAVHEQSPFLRGLISWMGFRQTVVDYAAEERAAGVTKYTLPARLRFARRAILAFSQVPLRLALPVGLTIAALCMLYVAYVLVVWATGAHEIPEGWVSLVFTGLFLGGIQLAFIGVLGEYLANVYGETRRRPRFIVRRALNYGEGEYRRFG